MLAILLALILSSAWYIWLYIAGRPMTLETKITAVFTLIGTPDWAWRTFKLWRATPPEPMPAVQRPSILPVRPKRSTPRRK